MRIAAPLFAALLLGACSSGPLELDARDAQLQRQGAQLLYRGQPLTGTVIEHEGEAVVAQRPYQDGMLEGREQEWYADGHQRSERYYRQGRKAGVHRGWWANGRPSFEYSFVDGEVDGLARSWFADGRQAEEHRYERGREAGLQRTWWSDGRVRANYWYRDGRRYGTIGAKLCISEEVKHAVQGGRT